ncbi:von Willebrand factor D and EGF domain-containing protein-like [Hydractinia symbiolongicarpus]|uniref:von Willebrand factor D and EGF domain-containing protein-like n=1 Tax=Hydractinia symbiolongicarpus TaxID=13093 RepID=UPI00254D16BD|nr:von Willebrand factor D and EGF domain-containing protein-like [Hydractinia symbiolongicarpus]
MLTINCKVQTWFKNTSSIRSRFIESDAYIAGIKITPNKLSITEGGRPVNVTVQVTAPIICADRTRACYVEIGFSQSHRDIFLSRCVLKFRSNQTNTQYLTLRTKDDFVNGINKSVIVSPVLQKVMNTYDWNCYQSKPIQVETKNVSPGYCTVTGDPYVTTFDRIWYAFFNDGDFVLVQSTKNNFKVQIRLFKCVNEVTCACAVIAQENDDILGFNMCNRTSPRTIFKSGHLSPGTRPNIVRGTNRYFLKFASGVRINFDVEKRPGRKYPFANIAVHLPPQYYRTTVGLCGTYDGDSNNDMISRDGTKISNEKTWPAESKFVNSWKLRNKTSLFFLRPANRRCRRAPPRTSEDTLCNCEKRGSDISESCTYENVVVPPSFTQDDYQTFISAAFLKCQTRKRRTTPNNNVIIVPDEDDESLYDYDPPDSVFIAPKWPTPTGKIEKDVEQKCMSGILNSTTGSTCSKLLKKDFDLNAFKNECISDVQVRRHLNYLFVISI